MKGKMAVAIIGIIGVLALCGTLGSCSKKGDSAADDSINSDTAADDSINGDSSADGKDKEVKPAATQRNYSGNWHIVSKNGNALQVKQKSKANEAAIVIHTNFSGEEKHTQWSLERQNDGTYIITNINSNKVVEVPNNSKNNGQGLAQNIRKDGPNQKWRIEQAGGGYVRFVNVNSGKAFDVPNNSKGNDIQIVQWATNDEDSQQFKLTAIKKN